MRVQLRDGNGPDQILTAELSSDKPLPADLELHFTVLDMDLETQVRAGENASRKLTHDFVALRWYQWPLKLKDGKAKLTTPFRLPKTRAQRLAANV